MTTTIETYLNSLSDDILTLNVINKGLTYLPDLTRFKNLQELHCYNNDLTSLPDLTRFKNLKKLHCSNNQLTVLPTLPQNLKTLTCANNQLTLLPTLPQNLKILYCYNNQLTSLPNLPQNLEDLCCYNNTISEIVNNNESYTLFQIKKNIQILNNFRHLYYYLKFKKQFRKWLWEKVREPNVKKMYNPNYLIENLGDEDDLDAVLDNWK